jgi:predicted dehydrogenase
VFVEKPFTLTRDVAIEATAACRKAGVVLAVGHNRRFSAAAQELLRLMENRAFGTLLHLEANFSAPGALSYTPDKWRANRQESPGGGLAGLGVHMIDLVAWLGGPVRRVLAQAKHRAVRVDIDDTTSALFDLESGASAYLGCCFACPHTNFFNVYGTDLNAFARVDANALELQEPERTPTAVPLEPIDTLKAELEEFAAACSGELTFRVTPEEATHVVDVMQAIVSSAANGGQPIELGALTDDAERSLSAGEIAGRP